MPDPWSDAVPVFFAPPWAEWVGYSPADGEESAVLSVWSRPETTSEFGGVGFREDRWAVDVRKADVPALGRGDAFARRGNTYLVGDPPSLDETSLVWRALVYRGS